MAFAGSSTPLGARLTQHVQVRVRSHAVRNDVERECANGDLAMSPFGHALCAQSAETEAVVVTRRWDARRDRADKRGRARDRANGDRATSRCGVWRQIRARDVWIGV